MSISAERDSRRKAILDAALEVFLERGVRGASIEQIRTRSGASVGSLYHRFGNKEGIAAALYVETLSAYQDQILAVLDADRPTDATVKQVVHAHLEWIAKHPRQSRYLFMERDPAVQQASQGPLHDLNTAFFGHVAEWTRPRIERGDIRDLPLEVLSSLWLGPSQELARYSLAGHSPTLGRRHASVLADAAWQTIRGAR